MHLFAVPAYPLTFVIKILMHVVWHIDMVLRHFTH